MTKRFCSLLASVGNSLRARWRAAQGGVDRRADKPRETRPANSWTEAILRGPSALRTMLIEGDRADLYEASEALRADDLVRAGFIAHRLTGSARLMGADLAITACGALESACREGNKERARSLLVIVTSSLAAGHDALMPPDDTADTG